MCSEYTKSNLTMRSRNKFIKRNSFICDFYTQLEVITIPLIYNMPVAVTVVLILCVFSSPNFLKSKINLLFDYR